MRDVLAPRAGRAGDRFDKSPFKPDAKRIARISFYFLQPEVPRDAFHGRAHPRGLAPLWPAGGRRWP